MHRVEHAHRNKPVPLSDISLSIVVTVYSETASIMKTVGVLLDNDRGYVKEIILLVSPRASDETFAICRQLTSDHDIVRTVVQQNNPGIGWAYREGMEVSSGNYVALMAADLETDPASVDTMVKKIEETGCDLVVANRWIKGGGFTGYDPLKLVLNWLFQKMFMLIFLTRISDLTFGFKIMSRQVAREIKWTGTMHEICVETTARPIKAGYYVEEVPSMWVGRREGQSVNKLLNNFRYVRMALKIRFERLKTAL